MTIGEKIKIARNLRGYTQKQLGTITNLSDVRIRQYELNIRTPKESQLSAIAGALGVSVNFFCSLETDSSDDVMHILFELEDQKGLTLEVESTENKSEKIVLRFYDRSLNERIERWYRKRTDFEEGKLSREEYDLWRARFPLSLADDDCPKIRDARDKLTEDG